LLLGNVSAILCGFFGLVVNRLERAGDQFGDFNLFHPWKIAERTHGPARESVGFCEFKEYSVDQIFGHSLFLLGKGTRYDHNVKRQSVLSRAGISPQFVIGIKVTCVK
jgi:hypothetical protein